MSLSEHMYGPHVLVCVRVRGAFQKKKKKKDWMDEPRLKCAVLTDSFQYGMITLGPDPP